MLSRNIASPLNSITYPQLVWNTESAKQQVCATDKGRATQSVATLAQPGRVALRPRTPRNGSVSLLTICESRELSGRTCVWVPAAGLGPRFRPLTSAINFVPVRLADQPLLACASVNSGVQHLPRAVAVEAMVFHGRLSCHLPPTPLCQPRRAG